MNKRSVRVGIQLPEVERVVRWPEYVAIAQAAEAVGFDSIWVGDHLLYRDGTAPETGPWEAFTLLAALAAATERVALGPLVACVGFHPPGLIAKMSATVDEISNERFVLGLGAGWNHPEFRAFGIAYDRRVDRFAEAYPIIRDLVVGQRVTAAGQFSSVDDAVLLPTSKRTRPMPIMIGSNGPRMLELTLPTADIWNTWYTEFGNAADGFAGASAHVSSIAERVGRDPATIERSACVLVRIGDGGERTEPEDQHAIMGTASQIAASLREIVDAGADELIIVADPITRESVTWLGDVLTLVRPAR
jgi:alkanesulfonate monooxygenase SsuD/methylene tetrahydromethanopterin reductase-like flavin-dependent oxidoreductase (luciferase family)